MSKRALILYTELAPYFLACLKALTKEQGFIVDLVRWPVNKEAPFNLDIADQVHLHERAERDDEALSTLLDNSPDVVLTSGWVDKGYLSVCRQARAKGIPTVMCSDTAWRGDFRQWVAVASAPFWRRRTFSHAWVSGNQQAFYAKKLGFKSNQVYEGFYAADVDVFSRFAERFRPIKQAKFPHRFLCVARYIQNKGHQYLCEAFAELCDQGKAGDWELICVGTGELFPLDFTHERIHHKGFAQPADLPEIQEACGVFVLPSLYEPWGVVVQENALSGFPLLLSDSVGAREKFLRDGENGFCFTSGSKEDLKRKMVKIIGSSDDELRAMGAASEQLGKSWSPSKWAQQLVSMISK